MTQERIYLKFILILRERTEDMKNILVIFNLMLVTSASTAAAECGFSKLNIEKTSLRTRLNRKTLKQHNVHWH